MKDQFMLKSVKSSKDGWIKLSTVAGFKRLLSLTDDNEVIKEAIKTSSQVELSDDGIYFFHGFYFVGLKIRRKNPLPAWDRQVYNRTVLISAFDVNEVVSVDSVTNVFKVRTKLLFIQ